MEIHILDELAAATKFTLEHYRECLISGRHNDASQCLNAVDELTRQAHAIEDHPKMIQSSYISGVASAQCL